MTTPHAQSRPFDATPHTQGRGARRAAAVAALALTALLLAAGIGSAAPTAGFTRVMTLGVGPFPSVGMARTKDGKLHLLYQTTASGSPAPNGLAARAVSAAGTLGSQATALSGWTPGRAGLAVQQDGSLLAVFGATSPGANPVSSLWAIQSSDGGASWSAPANVGSGGTLEAQAYGGDTTVQVTGATPVITSVAAGGIVVQQGLGQGSPAALITNGNDNFAGDVDSAVDAGGGVVASWRSNAGKGGLFVQRIAPSIGTPVRVQGQLRNELVIAGRDTGPGVFGAYTSDGTHVRLYRYGGGAVAVGSLSGVKADVLGVATGLDGRIWVMWGQDGVGVAVTRSNKAVTRFEPVQRVNPKPFTLFRLSGDGRLGPLDLFVDETPNGGPAGTFHGRVMPLLSASFGVKAVKNKKGIVTAHTLTVHVTDAGDAVGGAKVKVAGKQATTSATGVAKLTFPATVAGTHVVTITDGGYRPLTGKAAL